MSYPPFGPFISTAKTNKYLPGTNLIQRLYLARHLPAGILLGKSLKTLSVPPFLCFKIAPMNRKILSSIWGTSRQHIRNACGEKEYFIWRYFPSLREHTTQLERQKHIRHWSDLCRGLMWEKAILILVYHEFPVSPWHMIQSLKPSCLICKLRRLEWGMITTTAKIHWAFLIYQAL